MHPKPQDSEAVLSVKKDSEAVLSVKKLMLIGAVFYLLFLLLTPLGLFNDWIPPLTHSGYYSVKKVDGGDDTAYYSYLRSLFFDGDLDFIDERYYAHINRFNSTGYVFSNWQLGQAVLYLPFFLAGHLLALFYGILGYPIKADGYSSPYFIATAVASASYLFAGLMIMCQVLKKFVNERIAVVASVSLWMASPLLYYTFIRQRMAHTTEFFLAALFVMVWLYNRESNRKINHALMGGCLGLLCLIRLINANYGVLYVVDAVFLYFLKRGSSNPSKMIDVLVNMLCFIAMVVIFLLPQFTAWNQFNGFIISSYLVDTFQSSAVETSTSTVIFGSKLYELFFSLKWGLAVATPLWFFGLIGLFISGPVSRSIRVASLASLISLIVVMLSYVESDAYGNRWFIPAAVLFTVGLANLLYRCFTNKMMRYASVTFLVVCVGFQYLMIVQYRVVLPYNHPSFSIEALSQAFEIIFKHPLLLLRSTNFFRVMSFEHAGWNFVDGLYLLIFPAAQFFCVVVIFYFFRNFTQNISILKRILQPEKAVIMGIFVSLILVGIVSVSAPKKTSKEIEKRETYKKLLSAGDSFFSNGDFKSAQVSFNQASNLMPDLWTPYFKKGAVLGSQKEFKKAEQEYRKGLEIYPDHPSLLANYGATLAILGEIEKAEPILRKAIRQSPNSYTAYNSLSQVYLSQRKLDKAREMLFLAVKVNPNFGVGHANLAMLYVIMNKYNIAKVHLKKALELGLRNEMTENLQKTLQTPLPKL